MLRARRWLVPAATILLLFAEGVTGSVASMQAGVDPPGGEARGELLELFEQVKTLAGQKAHATMEQLGGDPSLHPTHSSPESGLWEAGSSREWTSGFFAGILWQLYEYTGVGTWREEALRWTLDLEREADRGEDHDLGFRIGNSYGHAWRLTGNREHLKVLQKAAGTLAGRFEPDYRAIRSWDWFRTWPVIIDNMMNLELLLQVAELTGAERFAQIALEHAATTLEHHVREDGSHYHIVDFGPGRQVLWKGTIQGYDSQSTWSRGQAWGIYGFTSLYRFTGQEHWLETARRMADWFLDHLPHDAIPFYDFLEPAIPNATRDASAAAIAASALIELYEATGQASYLEGAERMLLALGGPDYLSTDPATGYLLRRSTRWRGDPERSVIYADYYFLEALGRYAALAGEPLPAIEPERIFYLEQNYPNPFSGSTTIHFALEEESRVRVRLYDSLGRLVRVLIDEVRPGGNHQIELQGRGLAGGLYHYVLQAGGNTRTRQMIYLP